jgi:hypothetical protein
MKIISFRLCLIALFDVNFRFFSAKLFLRIFEMFGMRVDLLECELFEGKLCEFWHTKQTEKTLYEI